MIFPDYNGFGGLWDAGIPSAHRKCNQIITNFGERWERGRPARTPQMHPDNFEFWERWERGRPARTPQLHTDNYGFKSAFSRRDIDASVFLSGNSLPQIRYNQDFLYWQSKSYEERLEALEQIQTT